MYRTARTRGEKKPFYYFPRCLTSGEQLRNGQLPPGELAGLHLQIVTAADISFTLKEGHPRHEEVSRHDSD
jgi:hypothetical protein